ncbi:hypothetical protein [Dactylosporangium salmoneum]|uniref:Uncharacterized protein n=1 Tax=Dactylosporangium salmoneum TaxID=53361 RepID=A0ABP5TCQ4_9ACTN
MAETVTLHHLYYLIDTRAWLDQRIGAHQPELSSQLEDFVRCDVFAESWPAMGTAARMRLWCAARGYAVGDGDVIEHDDACLTKPVTIVLAADTGFFRQALALVSVDGGSPVVYADATTDDGYWRTSSTIQLRCPAGHTWTWDGGRHLRAADGTEQRIADVCGPGHSMISRCRDCVASDDGGTDGSCPCAGLAIYCPACNRRCQVGLPEIPTVEVHR